MAQVHKKGRGSKRMTGECVNKAFKESWND